VPKKKSKDIPYWARADPSLYAVSPQVT